jgi:predicted HTH domain antitoxin
MNACLQRTACCPRPKGIVDYERSIRIMEGSMDMTLEIPEGVVQALRLPRKGTKEELKKLLAVTLYEKGILGIGKARELAGASKLEFYALLKKEGVPLNYSEEDAEKDIITAKALAV